MLPESGYIIKLNMLPWVESNMAILGVFIDDDMVTSHNSVSGGVEVDAIARWKARVAR